MLDPILTELQDSFKRCKWEVNEGLDILDLRYNNVFEHQLISKAEIQKSLGHLKCFKRLNGMPYPNSKKYDF